jgi:hypothetical protein
VSKLGIYASRCDVLLGASENQLSSIDIQMRKGIRKWLQQ